MTKKRNNPVELTGLREVRSEQTEIRHGNILESIDKMDAAAEKKTEDLDKLYTAKTTDILWMLKKHKYEGW